MPEDHEEFRERLWPSPGIWLVVPLLGAMVAVSLLPVSVPLALGGAVVVCALLAVALVTMSTVVAVVDGRFHAGPAQVPVELVGAASGYTGEDARQQRGPVLDARAFLVLRGWVGPVVRVPIEDDADPTPYWLVSTRHPDALVAALSRTAARSSDTDPSDTDPSDSDGRDGP